GVLYELARSRASHASKTAIHDDVGEFGYPDANAWPPSWKKCASTGRSAARIAPSRFRLFDTGTAVSSIACTSRIGGVSAPTWSSAERRATWEGSGWGPRRSSRRNRVRLG